MAIVLQTRTLHRLKYLLNYEKKQFICFILLLMNQNEKKMLLKVGI